MSQKHSPSFNFLCFDFSLNFLYNFNRTCHFKINPGFNGVLNFELSTILFVKSFTQLINHLLLQSLRD